MANVVVVGSQWGDEGKGKIVDWLSVRADVVARFQGGHNAGHTLVINGDVYKLSLLPSGIVREGKLSVIGNGVVVYPWALLQEIETLRAQGVAISPDNLKIAHNGLGWQQAYLFINPLSLNQKCGLYTQYQKHLWFIQLPL